MNEEEPKIEDLEGKTLLITYMTKEEFEKDTLEALEALENQENPVSKKVFEDPQELAKIFTAKRQELIREVKENNPESISQLAKNLERGQSEVHSDLKLLEKHGIIFFKKKGRSKKPYIPYKEIRVEFDILNRNRKTGEQITA